MLCLNNSMILLEKFLIQLEASLDEDIMITNRSKNQILYSLIVEPNHLLEYWKQIKRLQMVARTFMALYLRLFSGLSEQFLTIITNNLLNLTDKDLNQDRRIENLEKLFLKKLWLLYESESEEDKICT